MVFFFVLFSAHLKSLSATHSRVQVALCTLEVAPASSSRIALWIRAPRARRRPKIHPPDSPTVPERFSHVWWNTLGTPCRTGGWGSDSGKRRSRDLRAAPPSPFFFYFLSLVSNLCHRRLSSNFNFMSSSLGETRFLRRDVCSTFFHIRADECNLTQTVCAYVITNAKNKNPPIWYLFQSLA